MSLSIPGLSVMRAKAPTQTAYCTVVAIRSMSDFAPVLLV
jgi:hypothetical protein